MNSKINKLTGASFLSENQSKIFQPLKTLQLT